MPPLRKNQPLSDYSTFGIGGTARLFVEITTFEQLVATLTYANREEIPFHVLGKGSNSLFDDRGFDGLVIYVKISHLSIEGTRVIVGGGYSFSLLGAKTARKGLSGLEFASGIPASVGGAVFMNAGAGGAEIAKVLKSIRFLDTKGNLHNFKREELAFSYRHSAFHEMPGVIVEATFELVSDKGARKKQGAIVKYRTQTQPYAELSCGCIFRNPKAIAAGALIEQCGLKGSHIGEAVVSPLHANFIVNRGLAKATDVLSLVTHVKACVKEQTGVDLEMELRTISF
jgi:UDP-N-acetylmuramate dehydrogenase